MDNNLLGFAYKYPFSKEAKEVVEQNGNSINVKYLSSSAKHIENAITNGLDYKEISINSIKLDYLMTYLYSRMILSAIKRVDLIKLYSNAESKRSSDALVSSDNSEIIKIAAQLNIKLTEPFYRKRDFNEISELAISFTDYVANAPNKPKFELVNQKLSGGMVIINKNDIVRVIEHAIAKEISKGLPIKSSELPKEVIEYSKTLRFRVATIKTESKPGKKSEAWIEKLLQTPIADVRHRTVNMILAPYLVNTKGLEVEQATKIINDYIEKCKELDPNTKITERYIEYQCNYAKKRGLKPLSIERAKELLGSAIEIEENSGR
jgi:hypothetical protein